MLGGGERMSRQGTALRRFASALRELADSAEGVAAAIELVQEGASGEVAKGETPPPARQPSRIEVARLRKDARAALERKGIMP